MTEFGQESHKLAQNNDWFQRLRPIRTSIRRVELTDILYHHDKIVRSTPDTHKQELTCLNLSSFVARYFYAIG